MTRKPPAAITKAVVVATTAIAATSMLGGCVQGTKNANHRGVPASPELDTIANTPDQNFTRLNVYGDLGRRMFLEDLAAVIHADRPTRLGNRPIPY